MTSVCVWLLQAMHLVYRALDKKEPVPLTLPPALLPPSKRGPAAVASLPLGVDVTAGLNAPVSLHIVQWSHPNVVASCSCHVASTRIALENDPITRCHEAFDAHSASWI